MANELRLIDATALEKDMRAYADNKAYCGHIELANGICKAVGRIDLAPTIDPESLRPNGRWEINNLGYLVCTNCSWVRQGIPLVEHFKHCPNCGAKMEVRP